LPIRDLATLGFGELLGALLSAVVEGQRQATASSLAFVEEVGFTRDEEGKEQFRTVAIRYTKLDENQNPASFALEVPLLAMVAIPTLAVRRAKVAFTYDVTETSVETPEDDGRSRRATLGGVIPQPVVLKGFVPRRRTTRTDTRESAGLNVEVTVETEPLPEGLARLLTLTELTVSQPVESEE
jgi:hypothetical protein